MIPKDDHGKVLKNALKKGTREFIWLILVKKRIVACACPGEGRAMSLIALKRIGTLIRGS
jgi:hypothetical protein